MATACLRLRTRLPERPLLRLPRFLSCIALRTFLPLLLLYLRAIGCPPLRNTAPFSLPPQRIAVGQAEESVSVTVPGGTGSGAQGVSGF